uniref:Putative secreted peptide n=1 Tax=Anopheles braziliensis TaxID=58242 RepID=A0A2M3ZTU6_9DIPT
MVFLFRWLHTSFASELIRWMNSVQQFSMSSLLSFATRIEGTSSLMILLMLARGKVNSSSSGFGGQSSSCGSDILFSVGLQFE